MIYYWFIVFNLPLYFIHKYRVKYVHFLVNTRSSSQIPMFFDEYKKLSHGDVNLIIFVSSEA